MRVRRALSRICVSAGQISPGQWCHWRALAVLPFFVLLISCAPPPPGSEAAPPSGGAFLFNTLYFIALVYFGYYVMVLLPRTRAERDQKAFVGKLKSGEEVLTDSGFYARFVSLAGDVATVELEKGTKVKIQASRLSPTATVTSGPEGKQGGKGEKPSEKSVKKH